MTQNKDRKQAIRELADSLGVPYAVAARRLDSPRRAEATAVREEKAWRIVHPEIQGRGGDTLSWRVGVPWDDRDTFIEMAGRHLGCYGWDAAWPGEITAAMTIPLVRNASGHRADEAGRLHQAAGVTTTQRTTPTSRPSPPRSRPRASPSETSAATATNRAAAASASAASWRTSGTTMRATDLPR